MTMATGEASGVAITEQIHGWDARISWRVKKPESGRLRRKTQVKDALDGKDGKAAQIAGQTQPVALKYASNTIAKRADADSDASVCLKCVDDLHADCGANGNA